MNVLRKCIAFALILCMLLPMLACASDQENNNEEKKHFSRRFPSHRITCGTGAASRILRQHRRKHFDKQRSIIGYFGRGVNKTNEGTRLFHRKKR